MSETLTISKKDLQEIVVAAITAAKAPNLVEQAELDRQQREMEQAQKDRKELSAQVLADLENKRAIRAACTHEHANGDTHAVYVQEQAGPGYFICQKNQCKVRPEPKPEKNSDPGAIYNTREFNRLFQKVRTNEVFG